MRLRDQLPINETAKAAYFWLISTATNKYSITDLVVVSVSRLLEKRAGAYFISAIVSFSGGLLPGCKILQAF
jgi:hypothetical protein